MDKKTFLLILLICNSCAQNSDMSELTTLSSDNSTTLEFSEPNEIDRVCKTNNNCLDTEICTIADIHGYKCKPIEDYDYKIIITRYEPFESCPFGFIYFNIVNSMYKSNVKNCPFSWEDDYFIYKVNDPIKISFFRSDPFEETYLGSYCFNTNCLSIPTEIIHEGKFFGIDDKNYGRIRGEIIPNKKYSD